MKAKVLLFIFTSVLSSLFLLGASVVRAENDTEDAPGVFPSIHITTSIDPFDIDRELWHNGLISVTNAALPEHNFEDTSARIRGRGNSTWWRGPDKRPLRFRFDEAQSMFGSEAVATDWILLANHFDRSLLRNYSALYLGNLLGSMPFTPRIQNVHLYVNGKYMGVYQLTDERDVNPGRLEMTWNEDPALSGFIIELDGRAPDEGVENETYVMANNMAYDIRFPGASGRTPEHMAYVKQYLENVSHAIRYGSFDELLELIDLDSFIDFYIVQEWTKNSDVHSLSVFMHINGEGEDRRLIMGPLWDFDIAAGNYGNQTMGYGPEGIYAGVVNYWFRYLLNRPEFFEAAADRWNEIVDAEIAQTIERIKYLATNYQEDFERNFIRHDDILTTTRIVVPAEILEIGSFMGNVEHLLEWYEARTSWLSDFFNGRLEDYDPLWHLVTYHKYDNPIWIEFNGVYSKLEFPPIMLQFRTLVELEDLASIFGLEVNFNSETGLATMKYGETVIMHQSHTSFITVNGEHAAFDAPSIIIKDKLFVPIRMIVDALNFGIEWDSDSRTVSITGL